MPAGQCLLPHHREILSRGGNTKCAPGDTVCLVPDAYVPPQPTQWSKKPNEWLTSVDIDRVLKQYAAACPHFHYTGFGFIDFAADKNAPLPARRGFEALDPDVAVPAMDAAQLAKAQPSARNTASCVQPEICGLDLVSLVKRQRKHLVGSVLNVSRHVEEGTHWVFALVFLPPPQGRNAAPQMIYFDSTAEPPPPEIVAWHAKLQDQCAKIYPPSSSSSSPLLPLRVNTVKRQKTDTECGMFALYAVVSVVQGKWLRDTPDTAAAQCARIEHVPNMLDELLSKNTPITDELVARYRNVLFHRPPPQQHQKKKIMNN